MNHVLIFYPSKFVCVFVLGGGGRNAFHSLLHADSTSYNAFFHGPVPRALMRVDCYISKASIYWAYYILISSWICRLFKKHLSMERCGFPACVNLWHQTHVMCGFWIHRCSNARANNMRDIGLYASGSIPSSVANVSLVTEVARPCLGRMGLFRLDCYTIVTPSI